MRLLNKESIVCESTVKQNSTEVCRARIEINAKDKVVRCPLCRTLFSVKALRDREVLRKQARERKEFIEKIRQECQV